VSFSAEVGKFATSATARVERIRRAVVIELFGSVIKDTPVLTGRLRGNWQTSLRSPITGELPLRSDGAAIGEVMTAASAAKGDDAIYLRNNLPYASRIEFDGWSHEKAPAGMMRKNVARILRIVNNAIQEGRK